MTSEDVLRTIEGLVFAAPHPVKTAELAEIVDLDIEQVQQALEQLQADYASRGFELQRTAGGYQFAAAADLAPWIVKLGRPVVHTGLSGAALELLAVIAYQQPVTKAEMEYIRGVRCDTPLNTLVERELVIEVGRKEGLGRPILYGTSELFLQAMGLESLADLPPRTAFETDDS